MALDDEFYCGIPCNAAIVMNSVQQKGILRFYVGVSNSVLVTEVGISETEEEVRI